MMKSSRNPHTITRSGALSVRRNTVRRNAELLAFVLPALIAIMTFVGIPFAKCVFYSFQNWNGISQVSTFIGLDNYFRIFTNDPIFSGSVSYTLIYAAGVVVLTNAFALLLAVIIEDTAAGKGFFRTVFYIPNVISLIVIGFVWKFIFSRVFDGLYEATQCGIFALSWLGDRNLSVICTILVSVWQSLGFYMIIYVAGLQTVPPEMHEAAMIDGAGTIRRFFQRYAALDRAVDHILPVPIDLEFAEDVRTDFQPHGRRTGHRDDSRRVGHLQYCL